MRTRVPGVCVHRRRAWHWPASSTHTHTHTRAHVRDVHACSYFAVGTSMMIMVTGRIVLEGEANPLHFSQVFVLGVDAAGPHITNEMYRYVLPSAPPRASTCTATPALSVRARTARPASPRHRLPNLQLRVRLSNTACAAPAAHGTGHCNTHA
ncbi:hypothetical protein EON67_02820 [archaeon]|nr:MAG: hypothetical protein EON67_02820 [archaeon]